MEVKILEAAWILPVSSPPVRNASMAITGRQIKKIAQKGVLASTFEGSNYRQYNFGQAIIMPGLINLHTHLEYTALQSLSPADGFLNWLSRLIEATASWPDSVRLDSVEQGIKEAKAGGATFIVDNSYSGLSLKPIAQAGLRGLVGLEIFGVDESLSDENWRRWTERFHVLLAQESVETAIKEGRLVATVAAHAPYTVCPGLWNKAKDWAKKNNRIILTHLAESPAEWKWFSEGDEEMTKFLFEAFTRAQRVAAPGEARHERKTARQEYMKKLLWKNGSKSPVKHLHRHGALADNLLAAHAVHLDREDIALLKANKVAIAHCPRSNNKLGCGLAPLAEMRRAGLRIGLGTDSRASNDDLDLLNEARFAIATHEQASLKMTPKQIIEHLTIEAARCVSLEHKIGTLEPGKLADIAVFSLPTGVNWLESDQDPYHLLVHEDLKLRALFVNGDEICL